MVVANVAPWLSESSSGTPDHWIEALSGNDTKLLGHHAHRVSA